MLPSLMAGIGKPQNPLPVSPHEESKFTPAQLKLLWSVAGVEQGHLLSVCSWFLHLACVLLVTRANSVKEMLKRAPRKHGPWGILSSCFPPTPGTNPVPERKVGKGWPNSGQQPGRG